MKKKPKILSTQNFPIQTIMDLRPVTEKEIDGVGMGVLSDGSTYLTARGLARMCGIDHMEVLRLANNWGSEQFKPRGEKIANTLAAQGYDRNALFISVEVGESRHNAFPESVCMAFLEYYAFDAGANIKEQAKKNYRLLARSSLRTFVYNQVGYIPETKLPIIWKQFQDRVSLVYNKAQAGYFSVFKEVADIIVCLIQQGCEIGDHFVPDGSVGSHWARYWKDYNLWEKFGNPVKYDHNYPEDFPQALSNPQPAWAYPDAALGEFRRWMREVYLPDKFPSYINGKAKQGALTQAFAQTAIKAVQGQALGNGTSDSVANPGSSEPQPASKPLIKSRFAALRKAITGDENPPEQKRVLP